MAMNLQEKELVYFGASVASGCKPCATYHYEKIKKIGASNKEIKQVISDAMRVKDSANRKMEQHSLELIGMIEDQEEEIDTQGSTRIAELVSIAAAFAVNCTSNLEKHIAAARAIGITEYEIYSVIMRVALGVKGEAASHVDQIAEKISESIAREENTVSDESYSAGCMDDNSSALRVHNSAVTIQPSITTLNSEP